MANIMRLGGGGGGLSITVVGGTTQPVSPKDNTVWVNTDVAIGAVTFSPNSPDSPAVGDVWVNTTNNYTTTGINASTNILVVSEKPYLEVNVLHISQWDGSAWTRRDGSAIYANNAWTTMALWFYNYGTRGEFTVKCRSLNGSTLTGTGASVTWNADNIQVSGTSGTEYAIQFQPMVDISNYNKLKARCASYINLASGYQVVTIGCNSVDITETSLSGITAMGYAKQHVTNAADGFDIEADLTNWSGNVYVAVGVTCSTSSSSYSRYFKVYQLVLTA